MSYGYKQWQLSLIFPRHVSWLGLPLTRLLPTLSLASDGSLQLLRSFFLLSIYLFLITVIVCFEDYWVFMFFYYTFILSDKLINVVQNILEKAPKCTRVKKMKLDLQMYYWKSKIKIKILCVSQKIKWAHSNRLCIHLHYRM